ncbi:MAG: PHP-associated domain-containing protein [archaeon]
MSKFDLHIHSCYSESPTGKIGNKIFGPPSKSLPEQIIQTALKRGLDVIAVADHDNILGSLRTIEVAEKKYKNKILVVPAVEVSSGWGHILAYNVYENIPKGLSVKDTLKKIKKKGCYAVAAHPFEPSPSLGKEELIEYKKDFFGVEGVNACSPRNEMVLDFAKKNKIPYTVGSDAHNLDMIGLYHDITKKKIGTLDDFWRMIKKQEIDRIHTSTINPYLRIVKTAVPSFFYWKGQQTKHIFDKDVFLPYLDNLPIR